VLNCSARRLLYADEKFDIRRLPAGSRPSRGTSAVAFRPIPSAASSNPRLYKTMRPMRTTRGGGGGGGGGGGSKWDSVRPPSYKSCSEPGAPRVTI